jgi:drug/metabolite transporter (DMT)-like permease
LRAHSVPLGGLYATLSMVAVAVMAAVVKWASYGFSSEFLMVVRWAAGLLMFGVYWLLTGRESLRTAKWRVQSLLGICWTLAVFVYYVSLRKIPLMDATMLLNTSSLFAPLLAFFFAGKRERWTVWAGTLIGFAGVVVVLRPGTGTIQPMALLALLSGFLLALRVYLNSQISGEPTQRTTFYSLAVGLVLCLILLVAQGSHVAPPDWQQMMFTPREVAKPMFVDSALVVAVVATGLLSMLQPLLVAWSVLYASVGEIAPFRYSAVVIAAAIDYFVWNQLPSWTKVLGLLLIGTGATVILMTRRKTAKTVAPAQNNDASGRN